MSRLATALWLICLLLLGCGGVRAPERDPNQLVRLSDDEVKSLDPQAVSDLASLRVAADQFEGLTRFNASGVAEPGLAAQWSVSADGLEWRFKLRPHLVFSDGSPITAQTFEQVFARLREPSVAAPTKSLFSVLGTIKAVQRDVKVHLTHPFPALPELLAHPALAALPLHRVGWSQERPLVTSGAYRLQHWALNDHIALIRNPQWHDGSASVAEVRWQPASDALSALRLFQAGGADTTTDFPSSRLAILRRTNPSAVHVTPYNGSYYYVFNTRKPPFNDVRVRRALNLMVDRDWIARRLLALGSEPAWGVVPPHVGLDGAYRPAWSRRSSAMKLAEAKELLRVAGYTSTHRLTFDIRFNSDIDHRRIAVAVAAMWKPLGVESHVLNTEASLHFSALRRGDFALARSGWIGDLVAPENYLNIYRSDAGSANYSGYRNMSFDAALDTAGRMPSSEARNAVMRRAEMTLDEDAPIIPIYYYVSKSLVASRVGGWQDNPGNIHPSRTLYLR